MSKKKPKEAQITVAMLDEKGIYQGVEAISESALTPAHVQVPAECDLEPGKYVWNAARGAFLPTNQFIIDQLKLRIFKKRGR